MTSEFEFSLGLSIRFYWLFGADYSVLKKVWCLENGNQTFCLEIKNRTIWCSVFRFGVRYYHNHQTSSKLKLQNKIA
jgi:hypothetical protein